MSEYCFLQNGDNALTVQFESVISENVNKKVSSLVKALDENKIAGVIDVIPAFCSLTVCYNCTVITSKKLRRVLAGLIKKSAGEKSAAVRVFTIPVCYEGEFAPDLSSVSELTGIEEREIIKIHTSRSYRIFMLGFLPGFAYLGGMDERIAAPRLESPRVSIPAGSVGIGGSQTGIYPVASPGGWRLIGKTPVKPYDSERENPILYNAGDYIKFKPITAAEFEEIEKLVLCGEYKCEVSEVAENEL